MDTIIVHPLQEVHGEKKNRKSHRIVLLHIAFCVLNQISPFSHSSPKFHSTTFYTWDTGVAELAWFSFPLGHLSRGAVFGNNVFDPDHPLWVLLGLPKPLHAVLRHALGEIPSPGIRKLLLRREIYLCSCPGGYFRQESCKLKPGFLPVDALGTQKQKALFSFI